jgi:hypothetical protein
MLHPTALDRRSLPLAKAEGPSTQDLPPRSNQKPWTQARQTSQLPAQSLRPQSIFRMDILCGARKLTHPNTPADCQRNALADRRGHRALDFLMLALLVVGFTGVVLYVRACVSLTEPAAGASDQQR